jgi:hypothetical protein
MFATEPVFVLLGLWRALGASSPKADCTKLSMKLVSPDIVSRNDDVYLRLGRIGFSGCAFGAS